MPSVLMLRSGLLRRAAAVALVLASAAPDAAGEIENDLDQLRSLADTFPGVVDRSISGWRAEIDRLTAAGERGVLWGSGSKAVGFLTTLGICDEIQYVVDIDPMDML